MAYLDDHPPARSQQRKPRREQVSGVIVVHTAENAPDLAPPDAGAEAVARFIATRTDAPGSYHRLADSDSQLAVVDFGNEAFHDGTGTNPHSIGISVATRADRWPSMPQWWRDGAVANLARAAADAAAYVKARTGIVVPARRITADQARARVPGFTTHAQLDPGRRSDPGAGFPFDQFLAEYAALTAEPGTPTPAQEDDEMTAVMWMKDPGGGGPHAYVVSGILGKQLPSMEAVQLAKFLGASEVVDVPDHWRDQLVLVDGPCRNAVAQRVEEWGAWLDARTQHGFTSLAGGDVDEAALAQALAPLLAGTIGSLSDDDVARIARASNDELARRQAG